MNNQNCHPERSRRANSNLKYDLRRRVNQNANRIFQSDSILFGF